MQKRILSEKKAGAIYMLLFLSGLGILFAAHYKLWPNILLVIGLPLSIRQFLLGARWDSFVSLAVFGGLFAAFTGSWEMDYFLAVLFVVAGLYIFVRDFFHVEKETEIDKEEELEVEIEEDEDKE